MRLYPSVDSSAPTSRISPSLHSFTEQDGSKRRKKSPNCSCSRGRLSPAEPMQPRQSCSSGIPAERSSASVFSSALSSPTLYILVEPPKYRPTSLPESSSNTHSRERVPPPSIPKARLLIFLPPFLSASLRRPSANKADGRSPSACRPSGRRQNCPDDPDRRTIRRMGESNRFSRFKG